MRGGLRPLSVARRAVRAALVFEATHKNKAGRRA